MGHVNARRRGRVEGSEVRGNAQIVKGMIPLSEMFGYATTLRSATQGRGTFSMTFDHYEDIPKRALQKKSLRKTAVTENNL